MFSHRTQEGEEKNLLGVAMAIAEQRNLAETRGQRGDDDPGDGEPAYVAQRDQQKARRREQDAGAHSQAAKEPIKKVEIISSSTFYS